MAFQENKPRPPQSETGEVQKQVPESQEQKRESLGDKIKRFAGRIGERLLQFSQRKQSAESVMKSVSPEATFTPQEQEQLTAVESAAQIETTKATEALQALETTEPANEPTSTMETGGVEAAASQEQLTRTNMKPEQDMSAVNAELSQEQAQAAVPETPKTPEQRMEALKQKAAALKEKISQQLTHQYGSVDAARNYVDNRRNVRPLEDPSLAWANNNFGALEGIERLKKSMEEGHEDYSYRVDGRGVGGFETFDKELDHWEYVASDRNISHDKSKAKGAFKENKEQQLERLSSQLGEMLQKYEAANQQAGERYKDAQQKGQVKFGSESLNPDYQKTMAYSELRWIKEAMASNSVRVSEQGKLQVNYAPLFRYTNLEETLAEIQQILGS